MGDLLSIGDAQRAILERVQLLQPERVPIGESAGRVLREQARAAVDLPPFPSSAMDGFAVRSTDTPGTLPVAFRIAAGRPAPRALEAGEAMGIATGGVVPDGADAVVPVEYVVEHGNEVEIGDPVVADANVREAGGDIRAGEVVLEPGVRIGPAQVGAAAAAGVAELVCGRRPRVALLATGTELQPPGRPLAPGQVYEANSYLLEAQLAAAGAVPERLTAVEDDRDALRAALDRGLEADVLLTSGGVSVGPHDLVRAEAAALGVEEVFWGVAVKPGKPIVFGVRGATLAFGLPGNPVSSLVGFELFVRPAVLALQGVAEPLPQFEPGTILEPVSRNPHRDELVRARSGRADGAVSLAPLRGQESHMIARAAAADVLVFVPRGTGQLPAGAMVDYLRL